MSLRSKIRDWFDAPRFCPDDGNPIQVEDVGSYDPKSGERKSHWIWHCPDVWWHNGMWSQTGHRIHTCGTGEPHWHKNLNG